MKTYRTTVTLDEDVHRRLEQEVRKGGASRKEVINALLRVALDGVRPARRRRFRVPRLDFGGLRPGFSDTSISEMISHADDLEGRFR